MARYRAAHDTLDGQFRQPTDVAWDTQGNIYISDGYINSRVAKFTKDGDWVTSIGEPGHQVAAGDGAAERGGLAHEARPGGLLAVRDADYATMIHWPRTLSSE